MKLASILAGASALAMGGCANGYVTGSEAPVLFLITSITDSSGASPLVSDVIIKGVVKSDSVKVTVAVRSKNPNFTTVPQVPMAVLVTRYEVSFVRSDGRHQEGLDVPQSISGGLSAAVDVATSGGVEIPIEVVRIQAKLEPPLINLRNGGGAILITCFANITLYGQTVAGQAVSATGQIQVDFSDFADQ